MTIPRSQTYVGCRALRPTVATSMAQTG